MGRTSKSIRVIITGGTIDKNYNATTQRNEFMTISHVPEMLAIGGAKELCVVKLLMLRDSQSITAKDRQLIVEACIASPQKAIVITHGTDTMSITAAALAEQHLNKRIVLTGAMRPFRMGSSDGLFNLGSAIASVQALPVGVYVVMNGRIFAWNDVIKDTLQEPHAFITMEEYRARHPDALSINPS